MLSPIREGSFRSADPGILVPEIGVGSHGYLEFIRCPVEGLHHIRSEGIGRRRCVSPGLIAIAGSEQDRGHATAVEKPADGDFAHGPVNLFADLSDASYRIENEGFVTFLAVTGVAVGGRIVPGALPFFGHVIDEILT